MLLMVTACGMATNLLPAEVQGLLQCDRFLFESTTACLSRARLLTCSSTVVLGPGPYCANAACLGVAVDDFDRCSGRLGQGASKAAACIRNCSPELETCFDTAISGLSSCRTSCSPGSNSCVEACESSFVESGEGCLMVRAACAFACPGFEQGP